MAKILFEEKDEKYVITEKKLHKYVKVNITKFQLSEFLRRSSMIFIIQGFPHRYCYIFNVLAEVFSGLLQMFLIKLGSQHGSSNHVLYLIHEGHLV